MKREDKEDTLETDEEETSIEESLSDGFIDIGEQKVMFSLQGALGTRLSGNYGAG